MRINPTIDNYNVLGQMGPLGRGPEYRPPEDQAPAEAGQTPNRSPKAVEKNKAAAKVFKSPSPKRLNLGNARQLAESTCSLIKGLDPEAQKGNPHHLDFRPRLIGSRYV